MSSKQDLTQYLRFLKGTLIPDLKESGKVYTAKDFERLAKIINKKTQLTAADHTFLDYLDDTLIPDLRDSGSDFTADDFEKGISFVRGSGDYKGLLGDISLATVGIGLGLLVGAWYVYSKVKNAQAAAALIAPSSSGPPQASIYTQSGIINLQQPST